MKNVKFSILGLSLLLLAASCKKDDFQESTQTATETAATETAEAGWQSAANWETVNQPSFSVKYFTINDDSITDEVADKGLVLVFKKTANAINALPFEEATTGTAKAEEAVADENSNANYWYHQIAKGSLLVSCDVYNASATSNTADGFKYFIITPEKLQSLEKEGYTTDKLMNLSYTDAAALLESVK
jgi:hypothetical protein